MTIFDSDPIDLPPVSITRLEDDAEGQALLDKLDELRAEQQEAERKAREARRPLPDLMAEADELAARAMVGDVDADAADEAEEKVQNQKDRAEQFRRRVKQCDRAASLVQEKLDAREDDLYDHNAEAVRTIHRLLTRHALQAERRAATLLRLLREFEVRYARYSSGEAPESHPQYLPQEVRTSPPRSIMGPARTAGGNVFDSADATAWMRRAADLVDAEPPAIVDLASVDFTDADARLQTLSPDDVPADDLDVLAPAAEPEADTQPEAEATSEAESGAESETEAGDAPADDADALAEPDADGEESADAEPSSDADGEPDDEAGEETPVEA
jgi:hypothetical protein